MKIKDSVFGSGPERLLFKALETAWPERISLYHNLPLLSLLNISGMRITDTERDYLKKTSVDYTACDKATDRPLVSVEFDGLGHGYSKDGHYKQFAGGPDPYRYDKMELKLRVAREVGYPFFVVSYDEAAPVAGSDGLTITHGIIGSCLAKMHLGPLVEERMAQHAVDELPVHERNETIQYLFTDAEVELDFEWNPLALESARAMHEAQELGVSGWSWEYLTDPELPKRTPRGDTETLLLRANLIRDAKRIGCRVTLRLGNSDNTVAAEAWIRNINGQGFSPFSIIDEVAELLAARKFLAAVSRNVQSGTSTPGV